MLHFQLITPDRVLYEGDADAVSLPTPDGEITVLPHHIPLISIVRPGSILVRSGSEEKVFAVSRGVVEVDGASLRVLADTADRAEELEEAAIEKAKKEAEKLLTERRQDATGFAEATAILEKELARLQTVRRHRSKTRRP
ncbi:MAG: ATP synthase F1 subunit epsilon [Candidatus Peribacteraceae bacterium]|nr:ATP synthase F1 subunit epsilon [Candidatus Peribacteraceae bacterium]